MAGLTFKQNSALFTGTTCGMNGTTNGSFLLATCLITADSSNPAPHITDTLGNTWSGVLTQSPAVYGSGNNNMYTFWTQNASSGSATFTLNITGSAGAIRFWVVEFTGQAATNPIATSAGVGVSTNTTGPSAIFSEGTGSVPLVRQWTNLTSIVTMWTNPPTSTVTAIDGGGAGSNLSGGQGAIVWYNNALTNPAASYTPTLTFSAPESGFNNGTGGVLLVKSTSSVFSPIGSNGLALMGAGM